VKLFIYEYASSVAWEELPASIRREGRAMFEALLADARASSLVGPDGVLSFTQIPVAQERQRLQAAAAAADYSLIVAPEFDGLLLQRLEWALQAGGRLLCPGPAAVQLTADKWLMYQHWRARGVPTPATWLDGMPPQGPGPFVSKWRDGAGSQDMWLAAATESRGERFLWQTFHPGWPVSVSFLGGPDQATPLLAGWQRLSPLGRFEYAGGSLPLPPPLAERAVRLSQQAIEGVPDLLGYFGVDLLLADTAETDAPDVAVEINPRLTTSYLGLRALSRKNLVTMMLALARGDPILPAWKPGNVEFTPDGQLRWLAR